VKFGNICLSKVKTGINIKGPANYVKHREAEGLLLQLPGTGGRL
jgi:hypothetical protein